MDNQIAILVAANEREAVFRNEKAIKLDNLSAFLTIAARLILIKSRALLPVLHFSDDEEEAMASMGY